MTPEERAREIMPMVVSKSGRALDVITKAIADAVSAEREANCKAVCHYCRRGIEYDGIDHKVNDGLQPRGEPYRLVACEAAAIRARGNEVQR